MKVLKKRQSHPTETRVEIGNCTLYLGDCLEVLKTLPDNSIDAVVTDPPAGINFMGKEWDQAKLGRDRWIDWLEERMRECFRVLKPGGHALVWALPRTSHWTATACEDAGFEIRDRVAHIFGTGFPKNMDVSKAIDKTAGRERAVIGVDPARAGRLVNQLGDYETDAGWSAGSRSVYITAPATPEAVQWEGWGTALKPACEDWWLCRKPLEGTVAANVLKYGTGAINIDGCRVSCEGGSPAAQRRATCRKTGNAPMQENTLGVETAAEANELGKIGRRGSAEVYMKERASEQLGRFPAHLIHDGSDEVLDEFSKYGERKSCTSPSSARSPGTILGGSRTQGNLPMDSGSASRFFYCTKASKKDRNEGGVTNKHPTVKNTELMQYLCRLITPPGGIVLDPFAGSFSTGKAAIKEGFGFIGIEAQQEYFDVGVQRIRHEVSKTLSFRH